MKNSNVKKAIASISISQNADIELINPVLLTGGTNCVCKGGFKRDRNCIVKFRTQPSDTTSTKPVQGL